MMEPIKFSWWLDLEFKWHDLKCEVLEKVLWWILKQIGIDDEMPGRQWHLPSGVLLARHDSQKDADLHRGYLEHLKVPPPSWAHNLEMEANA